MKKLKLLVMVWLLTGPALAQYRHLDFIGAGHDNMVTVTTSSATTATGQKTVDGFPIQNEAQLKDASRFLAQATFGADFATIEMTAAMGYESWLEEQFNLPTYSYLQELFLHEGLYGENGGMFANPNPVTSLMFRSSWTTTNLSAPDLLRHRMAFNLSQIMVINDKSDLFEDYGQALAGYYDLLYNDAFKNYQTLLTDVTTSPAMGVFLSHFNNPKENLEQNIRPDENYAREIMQLFSIGLWELNQNGTRKLDAEGQFIPTYSNSDIKEFAQVFTGLGAGTPNGEFGVHPEGSDEEGGGVVLITPMKMYEAFHDTSEKQLLNGVVLPANQSGMDDINQTIAHLSSHPNTAPFIAEALIKKFTTSNPSVLYVQDVANAFDPAQPNNMQEVIKAILLHPDARDCNISDTYTFGKLREPIVRLTNFLKAFHMSTNENSDFQYAMNCFGASTGQSPLGAPSVFNFYAPDYQPPGPISQAYLEGPEFQILNATNAIGLINDVNTKAVQGFYLADYCVGDELDGFDFFPSVDFSSELALIDNPTALINRLDILLANGLLTEGTKTIINNAISQIEEPQERLQMAIYLVLIAPDYAILK